MNPNPADKEKKEETAPAPKVELRPEQPKSEEPQAKTEAPKMVMMTQEEYAALLTRMDQLAEKVNYVADKDRVARYDAINKTKTAELPIAGISVIDGRNIIGWKTVFNEAEFRNGQYYENQVIEVMFEDGSKMKLNLVEFYRHRTKVSGEVVKKTQQESGEVWTIRLPDGKEVELGLEFIN